MGINGSDYREAFLSWLKERIELVGYSVETAPDYLGKAYRSGNPKDLNALVWREWYDHNHPDWQQKSSGLHVGLRGGVYRYSSTGQSKIYL